MQIQSLDTSKQFEEIYINLLRKKSVVQKLKQMEDISSFVLRLSKKAIREANLTLNEDELRLLFVKLSYGDELYNKLKLFLNK